MLPVQDPRHLASSHWVCLDAEGKLMTVFSAPDYPQFQPKHEDRFNNLGAVAVLRGSQDNYASPEMVEYPAAPRPEVHLLRLASALGWN